MHTGIISFCDRLAYNIKANDVKEKITQDLEQKYRVRILQKHWHRLDQMAMNHIRSSQHYICLRSNGNPYYMFFTRYEDVPQIFFIDKKIQPGYHLPRIILGRGLFDETVFDGTLLDGEMVKNSSGKWQFLVNDVLVYRNQMMEGNGLEDRLATIANVIDTGFTPDENLDVCTYEIKRYLHPSTDNLESLISFSKTLPYTNRGIYFWPDSTKAKPKLFNFDESLIQQVHAKIKESPDFRMEMPTAKVQQPAPTVTPSANANVQQPPIEIPTVTVTDIPDGSRIMWLRKTDNPDVYDVFEVREATPASKQGVAHVAGLKTSKMLHMAFRELNLLAVVPFVCEYNRDFQKWKPIEKASA